MEQSQELFKVRLTVDYSPQKHREMGKRYNQFRWEEELEIIADHRELGEPNPPPFVAQEKAA